MSILKFFSLFLNIFGVAINYVNNNIYYFLYK
jgi:hypothetical protein